MALADIDLTQASDTDLTRLVARITTEQNRRRTLAGARSNALEALGAFINAGGDPAALAASLTPAPTDPTTPEEGPSDE